MLSNTRASECVGVEELTKIANVAFQPPSNCVFGSKPLASFFCNDECHTFAINPPGMPSNDSPADFADAELSH
jgi:hypothetical protein